MVYALAEDATDAQIVDYLDGIWVNWLDEKGEPYPEGNNSASLEKQGDAVQLTLAYRAFETLPEEVRLEFYNGMTKQRFDEPTLKVTEEK